MENGEEEKKKVLKLLLRVVEVFTMTSQTLEVVGVDKEINESGKYNAVRPQLFAMDRNTQVREMAKLAAAPDCFQHRKPAFSRSLCRNTKERGNA